MFRKGITWDRICLAAILMLAGFLCMYGIWREGYGNQYYAAAVRSMLTSFHNFFFVSFDGGGFVSVDKPPLGLWVQTLFAAALGFHGWSLILPQGLAAVTSTALVWHLVRRHFGTAAGLVAALVFALTPIMVAVSRTNNLDTMVVLIMLLAAWAVMVAAERGSLKLLLASAVLLGLGFNVKMLQAFTVLPAIYLLYLLSPVLDWRKKAGHLLAATAVLLIISLSWAAVVELTPADQRPYIGSSQTNSVFELALGYNGIERVTGMQFDHIRVSPPDGPDAGTVQDLPTDTSGSPAFPGDSASGDTSLLPGGAMPGGTGGSGNEGGAAGILRMFNEQMAGQISWLLPLAILGGFTAIVTLRKGKDEVSRQQIRQALFWGMWLLPMLGYFSIAGFFHRYYLVMLAPGIAALCAIGLTGMWKTYRGDGSQPQALMLPLSLLVTALVQAYFILSYPEWRTWLILAICPISLTAAFILIIARFDMANLFKGVVQPLAVVACAVLLIAPALWSLTPLIYHTETMIPYAGPELEVDRSAASINLTMPDATGVMLPMGYFGYNDMIIFLLDNYHNETYLVAVPNANQGSRIILDVGKPVMAVGGFLGSDPILTTDRLEKMVDDGEVRYFLMDDGMSGTFGNSTGNTSFQDGMPGMPGGSQQSEIDSWVKAHGTLVRACEWSYADEPGIGYLYDLKGGDSQ